MAKLGRTVLMFLLCASAAQAQKLSAPANVCSAVEKGESLSVEVLEKRISDRKILLSDHDKDQLESSCKMMSMIPGFSALPSIWLKETEDGIPMHLSVQIRQQGRTCQAFIFDKEGC